MQATLIGTVGVGIVAAWAPFFPSVIRSQILVLALLLWVASVGYAILKSVPVVLSILRDRSSGWHWGWVGLAGICVALLGATQLWVVRILLDRPGLIWDVDWRYALGHAQAIARFGSLEHSLDFAGTAVQYHSGPAWLAGATQRLLGMGIAAVLFGVIPGASVIATFVAAYRVLASQGGLDRRVALAAVGIGACIPLGFQRFFVGKLLAGPHAIIADADSWIFAAGLMLNSYFALAVGMSAAAIILDRQSRLPALLIAAAGLGSMVGLKPQFMIGIGAFAGATTLWRTWTTRSGKLRELLPLLVCSLGAAVAYAGVMLLPRYPSVFAKPVFGLSSEIYSFRAAGIELLLLPLVFVAVLLSLWQKNRDTSAWWPTPRQQQLIAGAVLGTLIIATLLVAFRFPVKGGLLEHASLQQLASAPSRAPQDLAQSLIPLRFLLQFTMLGGILAVLTRPRFTRLAPVAIAASVMVVASPLPHIAHNFVHPLHAYEAVDDVDLRSALRSIPIDGSRLISSDLADPADNFARNLRGFLLTAYFGHEFYLANLEYLNYMRQDAPERLAAVRAFFGSEWSEWHAQWLKRNGITHVLVSSRCLPVWWESDTGLQSVFRSDDWNVLSPLLPGQANTEELVAPEYAELKSAFGIAPCL